MKKSKPRISTLPKFLAALRKTPRSWHRQGISKIRCRRGDCPVTAVTRALTGRVIEAWRFVDAAILIGMPVRLANRIADAADAPDTQLVDPKAAVLRDRLLTACGLKERR